MRLFLIFTIHCSLFLSAAHADQPDSPAMPELSLRDGLTRVQAYSPDLKAEKAKESEAESAVDIAKSGYYPKVEAQAIDSTGFEGSTSYLGVGGLMGSPFRSGLGAGVVVTQTLYDFGRTSSEAESSRHQAERQKQNTELERYRVSEEFVRAYFSCVMNRSQKETWMELETEASLIKQEVSHFVQTGQRSVVDRYLAETQFQEARTAIADYETREEESKKALVLLMGPGSKGPSDFRCPSLSNLSGFGLISSGAVHPLIVRAEADLQSVQAQKEGAERRNLPLLVGMGSLGYLQDTHLVSRADYSLGVGISVPIFEGFRIKEEINQASAKVLEKDFALQASRELLDRVNQSYEEIIRSGENRLSHLGPELALARKAFDLAKERYFSFQGELIDVRTALTNLTRVLIDENTTRAKYLIAKESKEVLNGAK